MTGETETVLHRWVELGDSGQADRFDEVLHDDVVVHAPLGLSTVGIEAEKQVWRDGVAAMPDIRHAIQEVVGDGSTLAARVVVTGTHDGDFAGIPRTGRPFQIDQVLFVHLRDGKIAEAWEIADTGSLLKQLGVLPG
jgi:steroid delta-isomerase-like uncharacterized protein